MFRSIFSQELYFWRRNPIPYLLGAFLFGICFISMWGMASEEVSGAGMVIQNSEVRLFQLFQFIEQFLIFCVPAIIGRTIYRDFSSGMYSILYSYPMNKMHYLAAKFASAFLVLSLVAIGIGLGFFAGSLMPGVNPAALDGYGIDRYAKIYLLTILPNLWIISALVFLLVLLTRNIYTGFVAAIVIFLMTKTVGIFDANWVAYVDPLANSVIKSTTRFWTLQDRNTLALPLNSLFLVNRIIWLIGSLIILMVAYQRFDLQQFGFSTKSKPLKATSQPTDNVTSSFFKSQKHLKPEIQFSYTLLDQAKLIWNRSNIDLFYILKSWSFIILLILGFIMVLLQQAGMAPQHGVPILPTTAEMLKIPMFIFSGVFNLLTFLYSGVLIFRDQRSKMVELVDTVPQPNHVLILAKLMTILKMQWVLLTLIFAAGVVAQASQGYYRFEWGHYVKELYLLHFAHFAIWACVAMFIHAIFNNFYFSFIVMILIPVGFLSLPSAAEWLQIPFFAESVLHFNMVPDNYIGFDYSDFNGYGSALAVYIFYKFYWFLGALFLLTLAILIWKRGYIFSKKERWRQIKNRFNGNLAYACVLSFLIFMSMGGFVYYQEHNVSKTFYTQEEEDLVYAENERRYSHLMDLPQPRLVAADLNMDIYPEERNFKMYGQLVYINKLNVEIDTILIGSSFKDSVNIEVVNDAILIEKDHQLRYWFYELEKPLGRGDTMIVDVEVTNFPNTWLHNNSRVNANGTFITSQIIPTLGVRQAFLTDSKKRKKYGLADREVNELLPSDSSLLGYEFFSNNMGKIEFETKITTSSDQLAFSMGDLIDSGWDENRRFFHFKSNGPIKNSISWLSGVYERKEGDFLDIYHHPEHDYNLEYLHEGAKMAKEYCEQWFTPLQHRKLSMVEFPLTIGSYATLNGNLIPVSEIKFLCDIDHEKNTDFNHPYFVAAHEVAHYWWGHQVDPANVRGGQLISEGMAEYISKRVVENRYGTEVIRKDRSKEQGVYFELRARAGEEEPLILAELDQQYLNYVKGGLALTLLSEYIGEENFNEAVAEFLTFYRDKEPPFPTSLDFINYLRRATPDSLQYLIHDLFETITNYDYTVEEAVQNNNNLELVLEMRKYRNDGNGKKEEVMAFKDFVRIALIDEKGTEQIMQIPIDRGINSVKVQVDGRINRVVIDPDHLFLDIQRDNNKYVVRQN